MRRFLLTALLATLLVAGAEAQDMKGRIYYNGNMSVRHLLKQKDAETKEDYAERLNLMDELFTMSVTIEFPDSHKMKAKMKIMADEERAKQLGVSWGNRKLWMTQLTLSAKSHNYWSKYKAEGNVVTIEDGTKMLLSDDGEELTVNDRQMEATLKRIK